MCHVVNYNVFNRRIRVADIKKQYMQNIAEAARKCDYIDKIILFGSCIRDDCTDESDIDVAIFGTVTKGKCLTSKIYESFLKQIYSFDDFSQSYDILYFKTGSEKKSLIMDNIKSGEVLYTRE